MSVKKCGAVLRFLGFLNLAKSQKLRHLPITMTDDDLVAKYAAEAQKSIDDEANKRIAETADPILDAKLRKKSLHILLDTDEIVPALLWLDWAVSEPLWMVTVAGLSRVLRISR